MLFIILYSLFPNYYGSYLNNNFVSLSDSSCIDTFTKVNKHTTASSVPGYFISCGTKLDGRMAEKSGVFDFKGPVNSIKLCATPCQGLYCSCAEAKGYGAHFRTSWIQLDLFSLLQIFLVFTFVKVDGTLLTIIKYFPKLIVNSEKSSMYVLAYVHTWLLTMFDSNFS